MKRIFFVMVLLTAVIGTALFAQTRTAVQLPKDLRGYNQKGIKCTVTAPNILEVKGTRVDLDGVYVRDVPYNGQKTMVIKIRSFSGKFPWDHGKMFGFTLGSPNDAKGFIDPAGDKKTKDKLIDGPFTQGEELVFTLPDTVTSKPGTLTFALAVFAGGTFELEFWFQ